MSATRENHWGELRAMLARPPVDFIIAYQTILKMAVMRGGRTKIHELQQIVRLNKSF